MRTIALLGALLAAAEDLRPRAAQGWEGFPEGAWVKVRTTFEPAGGAPAVSVYVQRLTKTEKDWLTLEKVEDQPFGAAQDRSTARIPRKGEAGEGERVVSDTKLEPETLQAAGKTLVCEKRAVVVEGKAGKRTVTVWETEDPRLLVKRTVAAAGPDGETVSTDELTLRAIEEVREVGERKLACLAYDARTTEPTATHSGSVWVSRDVPGGFVRIERETAIGGRKAMSIVLQVVDFAAK